MTINQIAIAVDQTIVDYWVAKFPDLADMFVGNVLTIRVAAGSYRPIWEAASTVETGYCTHRHVTLSRHKLEGFDVNLAQDCNCASLYYLLRDLEITSKANICGTYVGIPVRDYLLPDLVDIKADLDYSYRQCLLEVENTAGSMGLGGDRSFFGTKLMFQVLNFTPLELLNQNVPQFTYTAT